MVFNPSNPNKDSAVFGSFVLLENIDTGENVTYQLVEPMDSNIKDGRLSVESPLGQAIIGNVIGDTISISPPGGERNYELLEIF